MCRFWKKVSLLGVIMGCASFSLPSMAYADDFLWNYEATYELNPELSKLAYADLLNMSVKKVVMMREDCATWWRQEQTSLTFFPNGKKMTLEHVADMYEIKNPNHFSFDYSLNTNGQEASHVSGDGYRLDDGTIQYVFDFTEEKYENLSPNYLFPLSARMKFVKMLNEGKTDFTLNIFNGQHIGGSEIHVVAEEKFETVVRDTDVTSPAVTTKSWLRRGYEKSMIANAEPRLFYPRGLLPYHTYASGLESIESLSLMGMPHIYLSLRDVKPIEVKKCEPQ